jgi:PAS domain S-box-containing protein
MTSMNKHPDNDAELRRQAEEIAHGTAAPSAENMGALSPEETRQLLHELRVHQIELEMQNEELRRAQVELDTARARYFDLYDLAPVGYCTLSEQGLILEANLTAATLLGVARGGLVQQPISRFIFQADQDINYLHRKQLFATGAPQACEMRMVKHDGTQFWAHLAATAAQDGDGAPAIRFVLSDVTERKQAEAAARESEERFHALYESSSDAILLTVPDGRILAANPSACRMFGRTEEEIKQIGRSGVMDASDPMLALALEERQRTGKFIGEIAFIRKGGEVFPGEVSSSIFRDSDGNVRASSVIRDITERKRAEAALRENTRQLHTLSRRVLEAQETERRRVAHELHDELGQALTAIKINLQTRARFHKQSPDELNVENLRIVDDALQQVRRLALALRPSMLDDLGLLPALRWIAEQTAARSGFTVQFHTAIPEARLSPEIETACFRIVQEALTNIARHARAQRVEIDLHRTGDALVLCVQDDGCGFDLAAMRGRALAGGSIGVLGMQERAELIGGQLNIESTPGQGSTVRLTCPLRRRGEVL